MYWYQLRLLGSFQFIREGEPEAGFRSEKERALLAYLAIEGFRPHSRDALAGLLWPDLPDEVAHNNLRVTLHRLRRVLGDRGVSLPLIDVSREAIQLAQTGQLWIDVSAFQELMIKADQHPHEKLATCQACMAGYAEAVALYRGEFLQGVYPADNLAFSEWALLKREHLHSQALKALYLLTTYHQRRGELDLALGYARHQLDLEPWREEAHGQVMNILALRGERSAALRHYERCRQVLMDELRVEPAEDTRALYERILVSRKRRRHSLPLQPTPFLGRKSELNRVNDYLADPDCRLLTILGPGGIGKSRLAFQAAEAQVYTYLHGVFLIQLAGVATSEGTIRAISGALKFQFRPAGNPKAQLLDYLREKEILLVLDNCEQLLGSGEPSAVSIIEDLLKHAPGLRLLVTSRQRLNLSREWVLVLQGFSFPADVFDPDPEIYEAVQLFLQSARRSDSGYQPGKEEIPSIARICQLLEGVPLAIELAAAWIRVLSPAQIVREIERNLDFLASSYPDIPERHRSLRATFEHSYHLLTPHEQQALCRLSVFPAGFDRVGAEQVAGATLSDLTLLFDRSLLEQLLTKDRGSGLRYRMHELIKQYSSEKLRQKPAQVAEAMDRHRRFFMSFLKQRNAKVMGGRAPYQAGQEVGGEIENVRLALEQAIVQGDLLELGQCLNIVMFFYEVQGLFDEAESVFGKVSRRIEEIIHAGKAGGEEVGCYLGRAVMYHGWYCMRLARFNQAVELTQQGLALSRQSGDLEGFGMALNSLGVIATEQGKYQQAKGYLQEALKVDSQNGFTWAQASTLRNLGLIALREGDSPHGMELFQQALNLFTQLNDEWGMAISYEGLGEAALKRGNLVLAEKRICQGLEIRKKYGQQWRIADSLDKLGEVAYRRQQYDQAGKFYQESLAILRDFGERSRLALTLTRYGEVCTALGENILARESLQSSLELARKIGADGTAIRAFLGIAVLLAREAETEQSVEILAAILEHPSIEYEDKIKAAGILSKIREDLPPKVFQTALDNGGRKALEDLTRDLLRSDERI